MSHFGGRPISIKLMNRPVFFTVDAGDTGGLTVLFAVLEREAGAAITQRRTPSGVCALVSAPGLGVPIEAA